MGETSQAIATNDEWKVPLLDCHIDPMEGYLHTVFPSREVLAFSLVLTLAYEYPCTLGQQQPDLHQCLTYRSVYGIHSLHPRR